MAKERSELVAEIARRMGHYHDGTADDGSTTTIVDDTLTEPNDFWNGHYAYIKALITGLSEAPQGEERVVTDYDQATYTLTFSPGLTGAPVAGDTYDLLQCRRADITAAINAAIRASGTTWLVETTDTTTVTITADTFLYTLPTDIVHLLDVQYRDASDEPWQALDTGNWMLDGTMGAQSLILYTLNPYETGDTLRLVYLKRLAELTTDSATLDIGAPGETELVRFIVEHALFYLHNLMASRNPTGAEFRSHLTQAEDHLKLATEIRDNAPRFRRAGRWHGPRRPQFKRG